MKLVMGHVNLGNEEKAKRHLQELYETRDKYFEFLECPKDKHCLMFVEGDTDGLWDDTREDIEKRIEKAEEAIAQFE